MYRQVVQLALNHSKPFPILFEHVFVYVRYMYFPRIVHTSILILPAL